MKKKIKAKINLRYSFQNYIAVSISQKLQWFGRRFRFKTAFFSQTKKPDLFCSILFLFIDACLDSVTTTKRILWLKVIPSSSPFLLCLLISDMIYLCFSNTCIFRWTWQEAKKSTPLLQIKFTFRSIFVISEWERENNNNKNCHCVPNSCRDLLELDFAWVLCSNAIVAVLNACVNSHRILKLDSNAMHIEQHASSPWLYKIIFLFLFFLKNTFHLILC